MSESTGGDWVKVVEGWIETVDPDVVQRQLIELDAGLRDWRVERRVATSMAPTVNLLGIGGVLALDAYLIIKAFRQSFLDGLIQLAFAPFLFLAGVIAMRVVLEAMLSLVRINADIEKLMADLTEMRGHVSNVAERVDDLPIPSLSLFRTRKP